MIGIATIWALSPGDIRRGGDPKLSKLGHAPARNGVAVAAAVSQDLRDVAEVLPGSAHIGETDKRRHRVVGGARALEIVAECFHLRQGGPFELLRHLLLDPALVD